MAGLNHFRLAVIIAGKIGNARQNRTRTRGEGRVKKGWNTQRNVRFCIGICRHFITETKKVAVALFETISNTGDCFNFGDHRETIRRRRYGVIDAMDGRVVWIRFRLWPKIVTLPEVLFLGERYHEHRRADRCRVYFNQPWRFPTYLAVPYGLCGRGTRLATMNAALVLWMKLPASSGQMPCWPMC